MQRQPALVRPYNQCFSNQDWLPRGGVGPPVVKPKGIDDDAGDGGDAVERRTATDATRLAEVAHTLEAELKRIPGTRDITPSAHRIAPCWSRSTPPKRRLRSRARRPGAALRAANVVHQAGERIRSRRCGAG